MINELMESYLDKISEQVADEDKIVTYKSLSRSLGIHVNTAKQLLHTFLCNEKSKSSFPISATYLLAGKLIDGSFNTTIVNEADLKDAHSTFVEVTSEHVYSIQKGKGLKEFMVLCGIKDSLNSESSNLVIKCSKSVLKSRGVKKKPDVCEETNKKVIAQALLSEKPTGKPQETQKNVETAEKKESTSRSPKKTNPKGNQNKAQRNTQKPGGNIANLFARAAQKNAEKSANGGKPDGNGSKETVEVGVVDAVSVEKCEQKKTERKTPDRNESKDTPQRKKRGNKRKRIQILSDSEESDTNDEGEDKIVIEDENSPPCNVNIEDEEGEKEDIKEFIPRNKRKKRKVIDRTVMNEDGYLETKKEVVFETDSENEAEELAAKAAAASREPKKPKVETANDKSRVQGVAKKQSSILTFFKKS